MTNVTLITTGMLPVVVLASAALTAPVALFLLRRYRVAVLRAMATRAGAGAGAADASRGSIHDTAPALAVSALDGPTLAATESAPLRRVRRSVWRIWRDLRALLNVLLVERGGALQGS